MEITRHLRGRNCPVCGAADDDSQVAFPSRIDERILDDFAFASRKFPELTHLRLLKCRTCAVLYASPALPSNFLANAYRDAAYDSNEEAHHAARTYSRILASLLPQLQRRDAALEVGAGNGAFLHHLREAGFSEVVGIEPSRRAAATAEESIRRSILVRMFEANDFEPGSFDLFCCLQTLEHVDDPRGLCSDGFKLLRPAGAILLVTHDYESRINRLLGEGSPIFDIEHLQLFSRKSLMYLLERAGFRDIRLATLSNRYPLAYWLKLLPIPAGLKRKIVPLSRRLMVGRIPLSVNVGNIYAVGFKAFV